MNDNIVELRGITKEYRTGKVTTHALRGVDLTVKKGEFTVVAGPSGSGKTTLLNLIGALDTPTSGTVLFMGSDLRRMSDGALADFRLKNLGFVFQSYNLIEVLTTLENTEFVLFLMGVKRADRRERALKILADLGLAGMENRRPVELSGGQQQRIAVARALVAEPNLVLADEPTANLDSKTGGELIDMMLEMNQKRGATFFISSHDELVIERAKRVITLRDGRVTSG